MSAAPAEPSMERILDVHLAALKRHSSGELNGDEFLMELYRQFVALAPDAPKGKPTAPKDLLQELHTLCEIGQYANGGSLNVCDVRNIIDRYRAQTSPTMADAIAAGEPSNPYALLHRTMCMKPDRCAECDRIEGLASSAGTPHGAREPSEDAKEPHPPWCSGGCCNKEVNG